MAEADDYEQNKLAYQQLKETIAQTYPTGSFVGISGGRIVAAAPKFDDLEYLLRRQGTDPRKVLVVESGVTYPDYATIFI